MFLFLISGETSFDKSYYYLMVTATAFLPISYLTGLLEWKRRHQSAMVPVFITKIRYGVLIFIVALVCSFWRFLSPQILQAGGVFTVLFVLLNLAILPPLIYLGHIGGIIVYEGKD